MVITLRNLSFAIPRYFKNGKPITAITFQFETNRHYDRVNELLKEAENFSNLSQNQIKEIKNEQITSSVKR